MRRRGPLIDWKANFAGVEGNIATGSRKVTSWPLVVNLENK
jgi:hypothetical protein